jgi:putative component of membrane protein insertase Oxa1/YidC/SpoIIIJ protein YidD
MKTLLLLAIRAYQRHLSPHKGFRCAHHVRTGRGSCSGYGHRVITRFGAVTGLRLLRRRLAACGALAREEEQRGRRFAPPQRNARDPRREGGFLDGCDGCDGCDLSPGDFSGCDLPTERISSCLPQPWRKRCETVETVVFVVVIVALLASLLCWWLKQP